MGERTIRSHMGEAKRRKEKKGERRSPTLKSLFLFPIFASFFGSGNKQPSEIWKSAISVTSFLQPNALTSWKPLLSSSYSCFRHWTRGRPRSKRRLEKMKELQRSSPLRACKEIYEGIRVGGRAKKSQVLFFSWKPREPSNNFIPMCQMFAITRRKVFAVLFLTPNGEKGSGKGHHFLVLPCVGES